MECRVKFWKDRWCKELPLRDAFPDLFSMAPSKDSWVVDVWMVVIGILVGSYDVHLHFRILYRADHGLTLEGRKLLETPRVIYTKPLVGRVWKVLEMPRDVHTSLHYGGRHERVQGFLENSRDLLVVEWWIWVWIRIGILVASGFSVVPVPSTLWKNEFKLSGNGTSKVFLSVFPHIFRKPNISQGLELYFP
ncbi:hypothetical protein CK203_110350 [Vitis vinifera]|uniref:Uncharacterized protein n=1 Tax=Vitis vinifera TaxID=29760 RepID=A0A438CGD6_VITVI|nr:hypothetical protein CK203_110350 [Vitis vinifera]